MKKRCNRFKELPPVIQEKLIQEYMENMKDEGTIRTFAVDYYISLGDNFDEDGLMSDPY